MHIAALVTGIRRSLMKIPVEISLVAKWSDTVTAVSPDASLDLPTD